MLVLLAFIQSAEPSAFRAIFEDRPRQLVVRAQDLPKGEGVYYVFSPDVCAIRKVWRGTVNFRGKVYDFSQDNSSGEGKALYEVPSELLTPQDFADPTQGGQDPVWKFSKPWDKVVSKTFSIEDWGPLYFAFDEKGDSDTLMIRMSIPSGEPMVEYQSSNTIMGSGFWQFNYKLMRPPAGGFTGFLGVYSPKLAAPKELRRPRLFGDRLAWFDAKGPVEVRYLGYRMEKAKTVVSFRVGARTVELSGQDSGGGLRLSYTAKTAGDPLILKTYQKNYPDLQFGPTAGAKQEVLIR